MAANINPIFSKAGLIGQVSITAANTSSAGGGTIGTDIFLAFIADPANGSYVDSLRLLPGSTAASTPTTSTVARVFISSRTSGVTIGGTNTFLFAEIALPSVTADAPTAVPNYFIVPLGFVLPAGFAILVTNHAAPAVNTSWQATVIGGQY